MDRISIQLILNQKKIIRGEVVPSGSILLEGECSNGIRPEDILKAILLNQVKINSSIIPVAETPKKRNSTEKKGK